MVELLEAVIYGEWLGGFAKYTGCGSAYLAELWGVCEGLSYARRLNYKRCMWIPSWLSMLLLSMQLEVLVVDG